MKGLDEDNTKDIINKSISIKKKNKLFNFKRVICFLIIVFIAMISGYFGGKKIVSDFLDDRYENESAGMDYRSIVDTSLVKVQPSLVTISSSKENLLSNDYHEDNITGIVIDKGGYIISNFSKIKDYKEIYVKLSYPNIEPIKAIYLSGERNTDIALIKVDREDLKAVSISDEAKIKEGELVFAIGNATSENFIGMVTPGIITSKNNTVKDSFGSESHRVIQTNAIINKYNTGGALVNTEGELVGFSSMYLSEKFNLEGLNYSLSGRGIKYMAEYLISMIDILGIDGSKIINNDKTDVEGVYVKSVIPNKPAYNAGLLPTDIILSINEEKVTKIEDIYIIVNKYKSGDTIKCNILRDGLETTIEITII